LQHPRWRADYRRATQNPSMHGVVSPTFWCKACGSSRPVKGRKKTPKGWLCSECAQ
jgi:hypothetical protein